MQNNLRFLLLALLGGGLSMAVACGDLEEDCDPATEAGCTCTLDDDGSDVSDDCVDGSTSAGDACTCALDEPANNDPANNDPVNNDPVNNDPVNNVNNDPVEAFRFVLVQDLTANPSGDFPGADVDAISLVKGGDEFFAESFEEDTDIDCTGNLACDPTALLGAPDAVDAGGTCFGGGAPDGSTFTALNRGFVIVQFSSVAAGDVTIENGDDVHVYEVGATECGRFDDDPFEVSVSVSDSIAGTFIEIGTGGEGSNIVPVSGL